MRRRAKLPVARLGRHRSPRAAGCALAAGFAGLALAAMTVWADRAWALPAAHAALAVTCVAAATVRPRRDRRLLVGVGVVYGGLAALSALALA